MSRVHLGFCRSFPGAEWVVMAALGQAAAFMQMQGSKALQLRHLHG